MKFSTFVNQRKQGVLTAYNPMGQKKSEEFNQSANNKLEKELSQLGYSYTKINGEYNSLPEEAFQVERITLENLKSLGQKYNQVSVIWGGKTIKLSE